MHVKLDTPAVNVSKAGHSKSYAVACLACCPHCHLLPCIIDMAICGKSPQAVIAFSFKGQIYAVSADESSPCRIREAMYRGPSINHVAWMACKLT